MTQIYFLLVRRSLINTQKNSLNLYLVFLKHSCVLAHCSAKAPQWLSNAKQHSGQQQNNSEVAKNAEFALVQDVFFNLIKSHFAGCDLILHVTLKEKIKF